MFFRFYKTLLEAIKDKSFNYILLLALGQLTIGTIVYSLVEKWRIIDSIYFCVILLTTVGFGDFYPTTDIGKIFTIFYVISGLGIISSLVTGLFMISKTNFKEKVKNRRNRRNNGKRKN